MFYIRPQVGKSSHAQMVITITIKLSCWNGTEINLEHKWFWHKLKHELQRPSIDVDTCTTTSLNPGVT